MLENLDSTPIQIKNTALATELASKCKHGPIPFSLFADTVNYGPHGCINTTQRNANTGVHIEWGPAMANDLKRKGIHSVLEFGSGDGRLALETLKADPTYHLNWYCIEQNPKSLKEMDSYFEREDLPTPIVVNDLDNLHLIEPTVLICAYSLDSVAPIMMKTNQHGMIESEMGFSVSEDGKVKPERISNGFDPETQQYHSAEGFVFNLNQIVASQPNSTILLPIPALCMLMQLAAKLPIGSEVRIIDEVMGASPFYGTELFPFRSFDKYNGNRRILSDEFLREAGDVLTYQPLQFKIFVNTLIQLGFSVYHNNSKSAVQNLTNGTKEVDLSSPLQTITGLKYNPTRTNIIDLPAVEYSAIHD